MEDNPVILNLVDQILEHCCPHKIVLFNKKYDLFDNLTSFKLCVVVPDDIDTNELECTLYLELECEDPFDVLLYNESEWHRLIVDDTSFAGKILKTGVTLYEI